MANSNVNMSDSLGMTGSEPRELKLGPSFLGQGPLYHTIRYDFKPASVDLNKMATVEVNDKNGKEVLVTVPHADGAGVTHTVFKGSQSPIRRDCVLIINKVTGEITLEKLHTSVTVKKTRPESSSKLSLPHPDLLSSRKPSPKHMKGRGNASPKPPTLGCIPKHSPLHASPNPSLPIIGEEMDSGYEASTSAPASETSVEPRSEGSYRAAQHHSLESRSESAHKTGQHHNLVESRSEGVYKTGQHHSLESRSEGVYKTGQHHSLESRSEGAYKTGQHHSLESRSEGVYKTGQHHTLESRSEAAYKTVQHHNLVEPRSEGAYKTGQHHTPESRSEGAYKTGQHHSLVEPRSEGAYKTGQHHSLESRSESAYKAGQHHSLESRSESAYKTGQHHSLESRSEGAYKTAQHHTSVSNTNGMDDLVGVLSDSSSGDSSSDGDSSDSSSEAETPQPTSQSRSSGVGLPSAATLLSDDLQLSDSASDSD